MVNAFIPRQNVTIIEGTTWGDCGKGRAAFFECEDADIVIRALAVIMLGIQSCITA